MSTVNLGYENKLWEMADKLRNQIEPSEYKHVVLGLIFLKYITDSFKERYEEVKNEYPGMEEDRDAYSSANVFFVPKEARWGYIQDNAKQPTIGNIIDSAMELIEKENTPLKGVLPKNYGRPDADAGLTGRKIIVDTYGGFSHHGGGAFSGKDTSKVDRSAAYYARYAAKAFVDAGIADRCEVGVAYAIGVSEPVSLYIDTFGTWVK